MSACNEWKARLAERYAQVKASLRPGITLVAVSKLRAPDEIQALYDIGHRDFGENYVQELRAKQPLLPHDIRWHFIGHLQRSNVKHIVPFIHLIHGVDGEPVLDEIEKRAEACSRTIDVLLQVRIAREETKHGLPPAQVADLVRSWAPGRWPHVRLAGLMGMASLTDDRKAIAKEFGMLADLAAQFKGHAQEPERFSVLSMGMSGDLDLAMDAGSTMVRVGTAIFGERG